jgi:hypothetical protein
MSEICCGTCPYWFMIQSQIVGQNAGMCRHSPPNVVAVGTEGQGTSTWPMLKAETPPCSRHPHWSKWFKAFGKEAKVVTTE